MNRSAGYMPSDRYYPSDPRKKRGAEGNSLITYPTTPLLDQEQHFTIDLPDKVRLWKVRCSKKTVLDFF